MRKFLYRVFAFSLFLFIGLSFFWFSTPDPAFHHHYLKGDCGGKADWILQRMSNTKTPIDYLLLGSSRTMHGVDDHLLDSLLPNHSVVNFGYCRLGRDLQALLLERTLRYQSPKYLVLEVRESENSSSHPSFPYMANRQEVWKAPIRNNKHFLTNLGDNWKVHFTYSWKKLFGKMEHPKKDTSQFGYYGNSRIEDKDVLSKAAANFQKKKIEHDMGSFPMFYLQCIQELCKTNEISILYWYIPRYGSQDHLPTALKYYYTTGRVLFPPPSLLSPPHFWMDDIHLNIQGTKQMTFWLAQQLKD